MRALVALALMIWPTCAFGQISYEANRIGHASSVRGVVEQNVQRRFYPLAQYGSVYYEAWINTRVASQAELQFIDLSRISVGPSSRILLDEKVFKNKPGAIMVKVASGSFRVQVNPSANRQYFIQTPYAMVGITGTVVEIVIKKPRRR